MESIEILRHKLYDAIERKDKKEMLKASEELDEKIVDIMRTRYVIKSDNKRAL